jgi:hypothetical protein
MSAPSLVTILRALDELGRPANGSELSARLDLDIVTLWGALERARRERLVKNTTVAGYGAPEDVATRWELTKRGRAYLEAAC